MGYLSGVLQRQNRRILCTSGIRRGRGCFKLGHLTRTPSTEGEDSDNVGESRDRAEERSWRIRTLEPQNTAEKGDDVVYRITLGG